MLALLKTLIDITLLRKGPEDIPHSVVLFYLAILLRVFALLLAVAMIERFTIGTLKIDLLSWTGGLICYAGVIVAFGHPARILRTITAIIGCGALITFAMTFQLFVMSPLIGPEFANLVAILILLWSVPVKGHIISRAIDRHWYIGIAIAMLIFLLQDFLASFLTPAS